MGAIRSAYSCPVFWRQGQEIADIMHWYFADPCAQLFPYRHRFQTHYQYDEVSVQTDLGEQPGVRLYSKGNGPIGAPKHGIVWQGEPESFSIGVSASEPIVPLNCPIFTDHGTVALPPPRSWLNDGPISMYLGHAGSSSAVFVATDDTFTDFLYEGGISGIEGHIYRATWKYEDGGMRLNIVAQTAGPIGEHVSLNPVFEALNENPTYWEWQYSLTPNLPLASGDISLSVAKCPF